MTNKSTGYTEEELDAMAVKRGGWRDRLDLFPHLFESRAYPEIPIAEIEDRLYKEIEQEINRAKIEVLDELLGMTDSHRELDGHKMAGIHCYDITVMRDKLKELKNA